MRLKNAIWMFTFKKELKSVIVMLTLKKLHNIFFWPLKSLQFKIFNQKIFLSFIISAPLVFFSTQDKFNRNSDDLFRVYQSVVLAGEGFIERGDFQAAINKFSQALELAKKIDIAKSEMFCLQRLGILYWNQGQLKDYDNFISKALTFARSNKFRDVEKDCINALEIKKYYSEGKKFRSLGSYQESIDSFQKAINLSREIKSKEHELKCLRQLSFTFWEMENFKEFFSLNKQALKIADTLNHKREKVKCFNNIGFYYAKMNDLLKALNNYHDALIISRGIKSKSDESACLNNIGIVYKEIGDYDKSLDYFMKALQIDQELINNIFISKDLNNIGTIIRNKAAEDNNKKSQLKALDYFKKSLEITKQTKDARTEVNILNNIGNVYFDLKDYQEALKYFQMGYNLADNLQFTEAKVMISNNKGMVFLNLQNYIEAEKFFKYAIYKGVEINRGDILWEAYFGLGRCYEKMNIFSKALDCYKKSIYEIENIRSQIYFDTFKIEYLKNKLEVYECLIYLLVKLYKNDSLSKYKEEIFYIVEKAKARALLEVFSESKVDIFKRFDPRLKKQEQDLSERISSINKALTETSIDKEKRDVLEAELRQAEEDYQLFISKMRVKIPEITNLISPEPSRLEHIQRELLNEKTALIEYFLGKKFSILLIITKGEINLAFLPSSSEIRKSIKAYIKILSAFPKSKFNGTVGAQRLYKEIFLPVQKKIEASIENIIIVPDGMLFYLPFETLIKPSQKQARKNQYLIEKYTISYAPSASILQHLSKNNGFQQFSKTLLAFGNPSYKLNFLEKNKNDKSYLEILKSIFQSQEINFSHLPSSEMEIKEISKFFQKEKCEIFLKDEANEEILKKIYLKNYRIIHFACHGLLDEKFPFRSALMLAMDNDNTEDGFLQVREIFNLRLNADLVVLSACQTGKGTYKRGEGVLGLPRIFFYAGARSVISTLWRIDDNPTSKFMRYFYDFLSKGNSKAQALRLAKLKTLKTKYHHPFYWAAFVLNGEYSSVIDFN